MELAVEMVWHGVICLNGGRRGLMSWLARKACMCLHPKCKVYMAILCKQQMTEGMIMEM